MKESRPLFTFPGKMGDAIFQLAVPFHYHEEYGVKPVIGLTSAYGVDKLRDLCLRQPFVQDVVLLDGIENDSCGGQPWDFGNKIKYESPVFHMGYRDKPRRPLTLESARFAPITASKKDLLQKPYLKSYVPRVDQGEYVVIFIKEYAHWNIAVDFIRQMMPRFKKVYALGLPDEVKFAQSQLGSSVQLFSGNDDITQVANLVENAELVIGINSFIVTLAHAMKTPCIVFHRASSADQSYAVFSNYGENQLNHWVGKDGSDFSKLITALKRMDQKYGYGWFSSR